MTTNNAIVVSTDVLVRIFIEILSREELIGNNTYANAMNEINKKGEDYDVNQK